MPAEFATPLWQFGMSTYDFIDANTIGCPVDSARRLVLRLCGYCQGYIATSGEYL